MKKKILDGIILLVLILSSLGIIRIYFLTKNISTENENKTGELQAMVNGQQEIYQKIIRGLVCRLATDVKTIYMNPQKTALGVQAQAVITCPTGSKEVSVNI